MSCSSVAYMTNMNPAATLEFKKKNKEYLNNIFYAKDYEKKLFVKCFFIGCLFYTYICFPLNIIYDDSFKDPSLFSFSSLK